ncbi:hypothetical protein AN958_12190 [Leucoagaricus sp. SymC.cos]|nr:hypothetical protein AN958_12190 [Leucoagaricus sp. SymC.cos]
MAACKSGSVELLFVFDTAVILSFVLIAVIVATAYLSKYVHRRKVWYGQMAQWMIYCISYMLLFGFQRGPKPPEGLCIFQASLIYASPPACAVGSACFMIDFYMSLNPLHRRSTPRMPKLDFLLITLPWITLVGAALQVVLFAVVGRRLDAVRRTTGFFLCNISDPEPTIVSVVLVLVALVVWFYYEVQSGIIMYQNRLEFARLNYRTSRGFISLYIRSAVFTIGILIGTALSIYSLRHSKGPSGMGDLSVALPFSTSLIRGPQRKTKGSVVPIFVALVFGTQKVSSIHKFSSSFL